MLIIKSTQESLFKILLCSVFLFISVLCVSHTYENYSNSFKKDIQVVVARYKEDLQFIKDGEFDEFDVIIYNKGDLIEDPLLKDIPIVDLPNIGKIDHTILYHIIENYDNLHETTIFIPGSFMGSQSKKDRVDAIINTLNSNKTVSSALLPIKMEGPINEVLYDFKMNNYESQYGPNKNPTVDNSMMLSPVRPFGEWYRKVFGNKKMDQLFYYGIFAVSREEILNNPREKYMEIIKYVDSHPNPEAGHYIERSWVTLFS